MLAARCAQHTASFFIFDSMILKITTSNAIDLLIQLVIAGVIFWLIVWLLRWIGVPEPFNKVIKVIIGIVVVLWLVNILMGFSGKSFL